MKIKLSLLLFVILASGCASQHSKPNIHWSYSGHTGPENWGSLNSKYATCAKGVNQSPVNLTNLIESDLTPLNMVYQAQGYEIINNGHTIQVNYQSGSTLSVDGHQYELKQFHFHSPSENHINGQSYPLEAHLVHADEAGHLAVVAVMFEEGDENKTLEKVWRLMPEKANTKSSVFTAVSVEGILPSDRDYYRFNGSLTTPPCSEGVLWLVMKQAITVSKEQVERFTDVMHHPNNRPIQAIQARSILK